MLKGIQVVKPWILERWILVAYLIINWQIGHLAEQFEIAPSKEFFELTAKYLNEYVQEGVMPPDQIAGAIMNMADDFMAGKQITMRAGDYIAIQNYAKGMG